MRTARPRTWPGGRAVTLALVALIAGCGSNSAPPTPPPSPSPSAVQPGGPVAGAYILQITPSASCPMARTPLSFPMTAAPTSPTTHPGVQVILDPNGRRLELEAIEENFTIRGGLGTNDEGVTADQGVWVWVRAIAAGPVQRSANGNGEVVTGTLAGYLALAAEGEFEGSLGTCNASDHAFTLRTR